MSYEVEAELRIMRHLWRLANTFSFSPQRTAVVQCICFPFALILQMSDPPQVGREIVPFLDFKYCDSNCCSVKICLRAKISWTAPSFSGSGIISILSELDQDCAIIVPTIGKDGPAIYSGMHFGQHECSWQGWLTRYTDAIYARSKWSRQPESPSCKLPIRKLWRLGWRSRSPTASIDLRPVPRIDAAYSTLAQATHARGTTRRI
jgi:hypothetical protein